MLRFVAPVALLSLMFAATALADDEIHAGNWEFVTQARMPGMPQPATSARLPPGVSIGPGGITHTHTGCISTEQPFPVEPGSKCTIEKNDRQGGKVTWAANCTTAHGQVHAEGVATYTGDTMKSTASFRIIGRSGQATDTTTQTTGHYLGSCPE